MSEEILHSIQNIEHEAQSIREKFEKKIEELKEETLQKQSMAQHNMEHALNVYKEELLAQNDEKMASFLKVETEKTEQLIQQLRQQFLNGKEEYVQLTIKEVLSRYGNR